MAAPDRVEKGSTKADGTESIRYYKNLGNGYIVVVEQEGRFDVGDMEAITMWAERTDNKKSHPTNVSDARKNRPLNSTSQPAPTSTTETGTVIISPNDTAKIKQDFESAVKKVRRAIGRRFPKRERADPDCELQCKDNKIIERCEERPNKICSRFWF